MVYQRLTNLFLKKSNLNSEGQETISFGNSPMSTDELQSIDNDFIHLIPNDYIQFLKQWNGCTLFDLNSQAGFYFFGLNEIENETQTFKEIYESDWDESIVLFCSVAGSGDFIGFRNKLNGYEIIDCCHDDIPKNWSVINNSLSEFINKILDSKGLSFWLPQ